MGDLTFGECKYHVLEQATRVQGASGLSRASASVSALVWTVERYGRGEHGPIESGEDPRQFTQMPDAFSGQKSRFWRAYA